MVTWSHGVAPDPRDWIESIVSRRASSIDHSRTITRTRHDMARRRNDLRVMQRPRTNPSARVSAPALWMALQRRVGYRGRGRTGEAHVSRKASAAPSHIRGLSVRVRPVAGRVPEGGTGHTISNPHMVDPGRFPRNGDIIRPGPAAGPGETPATGPVRRGYAPYDLMRSSMALSSSSHTRWINRSASVAVGACSASARFSGSSSPLSAARSKNANR